jgi:hypothetical protein
MRNDPIESVLFQSVNAVHVFCSLAFHSLLYEGAIYNSSAIQVQFAALWHFEAIDTCKNMIYRKLHKNAAKLGAHFQAKVNEMFGLQMHFELDHRPKRYTFYWTALQILLLRKVCSI